MEKDTFAPREYLENLKTIAESRIEQAPVEWDDSDENDVAALFHDLRVYQAELELEAFNEAMVEREMRIIEMKEEVNGLAAELGREAPYPPVWREE